MVDVFVPGLYVAAGVAAYATVHHLTTARNSPQRATQMTFAGVCLFAVPFAVLHANALQAANVADFIAATRWGISDVMLLFIAFLWYVALDTGKRSLWLLVPMSVWFGFLSVVNLTLPFSVQFDHIEGIYRQTLPWGEIVSRGAGGNGPWAYITVVTVLAAYGYAIFALYDRHWVQRRRVNIWMVFAIAFFLLSTLEGVLVRLSIIHFIELGPYGTLGMVFAASVALTREVQLQLRTSEENFRSLFENSPSAMVAIDPKNLRIVQANRNASDLTGYSHEELLTKTVADVTRREDMEESRLRYERIMGGQSEYEHYERHYLRKDGSSVLTDSRVSVLKDQDATVLRFIVSATDIAEREQAELALRRESEKNRILLRNASDGIHILDTQGNLIEASDSFCNMLGYARDETIGMHVSRWDAQLSGTALRDRVKASFAPSERSQFETRHRRKDGSTFDVEVSTYPLELNGAQALFCSSRDITERRQAILALEESEARFRTIVEQAPIGMTFGRDGVTLDANAKFLQMYGYDNLADLCAMPALDGIAPECRGDVAERMRKRMQGEETESEYETVGLRKDGSRIPVFVSAKRVVLRDGPMTYAFVIDFSERKANEEKIAYLAYYDQVTALPNRRLFSDRLHQALVSGKRGGRLGSLLLIDLDDFKTVNDTLGHLLGDEMLQQVAQRLASCLRDADTVARLGGDEFIVMVDFLNGSALDAAAHTETVGMKLLEVLRQPYKIGEAEFHCTASIGAVLFDDCVQKSEELIKQADIAMYQAKKSGRNTMRFFDPTMQETINARVALEGELHNAIADRQFQLHYQIQKDSESRPIGAEALIRWTHPQQGPLSPNRFIPLAEETGLILPIGRWVVETACAQIKAWQRDDLARNLVLSVNVSSRQMRDANFVEHIQASIAHHGIDSRLLKLEITESMLLDDIEGTIAKMNALREGGVQFSLDDFGTGYSSLRYLNRLPLQQLKIDQSFVRDIANNAGDLAIVQTIIAMARSLDLDVIAEGVETEEQRKLLLSKGCKEFQGYFFGRPVPIEHFDAALK